MIVALLIIAAYLLGSIPSSYLAGLWMRGIDLREHGSGNLGATNTFRVFGPRIAVPVVAIDILKGFAPSALFQQWDGQGAWTWSLAYGGAAILGHVFSIYMRFRGGKGVATAAGVFLALAPVAVASAFVAWVAVVAISRMVSLASLGAAVVLIAALLVTENPVPVQLLGVAVAVFVVFAHRTNIVRIARGEEYRFGAPKHK
jgi:acyl phosphate:glycerol-3-phosphate acyltransferase